MMKRLINFFLIFNIFLFNLGNVFALTDLPEIQSTHVGIYNRENMELLYGIDEEEVISVASLTKLMTAVVAIENIEDLNETVIIDYNIISATLDWELSVAGIEDGQELSYYDLLETLLLPSGADSAIYLSNTIFNTQEEFIEKMNEKAKELGMNNTSFSNETGLDDEDNYSTISDIAILMDYVLDNEVLKDIICTSEYTTTDGNLTVTNTIQKAATRNGITLNYILGGKTGSTGEAGICLASFTQTDDVELIMVVTGASMYSSWPYHITDSESLYEWVFENFSTQAIVSTDDVMLVLPTVYCKQDSVTFYFEETIEKFISDVDEDKIEVVYSGLETLNPSITSGTKLGEAAVYYDGEYLDTVEVYLNENLEFSFKKWFAANKEYCAIGSICFVIIVIIILMTRTPKKKSRRK